MIETLVVTAILFVLAAITALVSHKYMTRWKASKAIYSGSYYAASHFDKHGYLKNPDAPVYHNGAVLRDDYGNVVRRRDIYPNAKIAP